jgi:hypothetical protein
MRVHTYEFVCDQSIVRFRTYDLVILLFITFWKNVLLTSAWILDPAYTFVHRWLIMANLILPNKKSIIGQALARFFCGLLIGSNIGINATWISTITNKIADEISRIKKFAHNPFSFQFDFAKLQQDHAELRHCRFFQPSHELLSMIWDILLTRNLPDLDKVRLLKQNSLGKLSIKNGVSKSLFPTPAETSPDMSKSLPVLLKI